MNILIITQRVDRNDDNLGFFHEWIKRFARETSQLVVIGQHVGDYSLPSNVKVISLGKEKNFSKIRQLFNFYDLLFKSLTKVDAVFIHMIPMWVILGWPIFKLYRKNIFLWYVHKSVGFWLKLAEKIVKNIFTASAESFRLPSKKIIITGHGIDTDYFVPDSNRKNDIIKVLSVGRISETKRIKEIVESALILKHLNFSGKVKFIIIGAPRLKQDFNYLKEVMKIIKKEGLESLVEFKGALPYSKIAAEYGQGHIFLNFSQTGSVDKVVLEAMSCGLNIITSNEAFFKILPEENIIKDPKPQNIAERIRYFLDNKKQPAFNFRDYVVKNHNLNSTIKKIVAHIFS